MGIISSIKNAVKKRLDNYKTTQRLVESIGPEGIIGQRNMSYYTRKIGKMVKSGDIIGAEDYAKKEKDKVLRGK